MFLPVDEHIRQVHILALQRLARRRTLGVGEQRVQLLLEHLEAKLARRLMVFQQFLDAVRKLFEHSPDIDTGGFVLRAMGYWHLGQPSGVFVIDTKHCSRGSLPRLPSFGLLT